MAAKFLIVCGGSGIGLLENREVLGIHAELQIDVRTALLKDSDNSFRLSIDEDEDGDSLTVRELIERSYNDLFVDNLNNQEILYGQSTYYNKTDKNHIIELLNHEIANKELSTGLSQSPAIGSLAVRLNVKKLDAAIKDLFGTLQFIGAGNKDIPAVWIVASTAGGTGEGIHRFVAARIIQYLKSAGNVKPEVHFHFIRIGPMTYQRADTVSDKPKMNTFFGVAADLGFYMQTIVDYPTAVIKEYFLDLPDVGLKTEEEVNNRLEMIELACKAIMWDEMQSAFKQVENNYHSIPFFLVKIGSWGGDFDDDKKYFHTLIDLNNKLSALLKPDMIRLKHLYLVDQREKIPQEPNWEKDIKVNLSVNGLAKHIKNKLKLSSITYEACEEFIYQLLEKMGVRESDIENKCRVQYPYEDEKGKTLYRDDDLVAQISRNNYDQDWMADITHARFVEVWCNYLLKGDTFTIRDDENNTEDTQTQEYVNKGYEVELTEYANSVYQIFRWAIFSDANKIAEKLLEKDLLIKFIKVFSKIKYIKRCQESVRIQLNNKLSPIKGLGEFVANQLKQEEKKNKILLQHIEAEISACDLETIIDIIQGKSWLDALSETNKSDEEVFRKIVLKGAIRLPKNGLTALLQLKSNADLKDIFEKMKSDIKIRIRKKTYESVWWQGVNHKHSGDTYRIMPMMERSLEKSINDHLRDHDYNYTRKTTPIGNIGLNILSFEAGLFGGAGDVITTPLKLMEPFVTTITTQLDSEWMDDSKWDNTVGEECGQMAIIKAGPIGEPLYKPVLQKILNPEMLIKIMKIYPTIEITPKIPKLQ